MITMQEIEPLALCMVTHDLFERDFRSSFGDNLLLRSKDHTLEPLLVKVKRDLNFDRAENKYLAGHKTTIVYNIDRILALSARYASIDFRTVERIVISGKEMIKDVINSSSFEEISSMEPRFKSQILLPMYELFTKSEKKKL